MNNFNQGKIYTIISVIGHVQYIGSTCKRLSMRMSQHLSSYKKYLNDGGPNMTSYKVLAFSDATISLLEAVSVETGCELRALEGQYIRRMDCVNKNIPTNFSTYDMKDYGRRYYNANKKKMNQTSKAYYHRNGIVRCNLCMRSMSQRRLALHNKTSWRHQINLINSI